MLDWASFLLHKPTLYTSSEMIQSTARKSIWSLRLHCETWVHVFRQVVGPISWIMFSYKLIKYRKCEAVVSSQIHTACFIAKLPVWRRCLTFFYFQILSNLSFKLNIKCKIVKQEVNLTKSKASVQIVEYYWNVHDGGCDRQWMNGRMSEFSCRYKPSAYHIKI